MTLNDHLTLNFVFFVRMSS